MGATMSSMETRTEANISPVTSFHSAAQWKAHLNASSGSDKLMVIDFTAAWCGPCHSMEPTINEFAMKYTDVEFIKIDVDELLGVEQEYGIQAMPTFLFIKKGKVIDKVVGAKRDELKSKIDNHRML